MKQYKQLKWANWQLPYTGGQCLNYVARAYGGPFSLKGRNLSTAESWWNTLPDEAKRYGLVPDGLEAPIFFRMEGEPAGHIAIRLADGTVASSSLYGVHNCAYHHPSLDDMMRFYGGRLTYIGWSTAPFDSPIITEEEIVEVPRPPAGYELMTTPRGGAVFKRVVGTAVQCVDANSKIKFLVSQGCGDRDGDYLPMSKPRHGAKYKRVVGELTYCIDENNVLKLIVKSNKDFVRNG